MKKFKTTRLIPLVLLFVFYLLNSSASDMRPSEVADLSINEEVIYIDVREKNEILEGMLQGALWFPLSRMNEQGIKSLVEKSGEKKILVYCRSGARSERAKKMIQKFSNNVFNIGGFGSLKENDKIKTYTPKESEIRSCCG